LTEQVFPVTEEGHHWMAHGLASLADKTHTVSGLLMGKLRRIPEEGST
tara:strand:+ start:2054 stop:2197 length:144 start_codon:yes stop_codon:yes gene_type:complete